MNPKIQLHAKVNFTTLKYIITISSLLRSSIINNYGANSISISCFDIISTEIILEATLNHLTHHFLK